MKETQIQKQNGKGEKTQRAGIETIIRINNEINNNNKQTNKNK